MLYLSNIAVNPVKGFLSTALKLAILAARRHRPPSRLEKTSAEPLMGSIALSTN